jgi:hypothetical protein
MNKFENSGFTSILTNEKLKIEIPIKNLVFAFNNCPDNYNMKILRGRSKQFAEFCAKHIVEECNQENGDTYLTEAFDKMFGLIFDGYELADEFAVEVDEDDMG